MNESPNLALILIFIPLDIKTGFMASILKWCPRPDSNWHAREEQRIWIRASTNSATRKASEYNRKFLHVQFHFKMFPPIIF